MKNFSIIKSRRLRSTPYTDRIESHGVSGYTVYNHMLLPVYFKSVEADYEHLKKFVQVWDVAAERQVEISGKDSSKLVQLMTCRDLSKSRVGKCYYAPLIDNDGLLVNDPIINKLAEDKWWLSIADADVIFFAKGLAAGNRFDVEINEPNVNILAVQGPLADVLMSKLFGEEIRKLKFFNFDYFHSFVLIMSGVCHASLCPPSILTTSPVILLFSIRNFTPLQIFSKSTFFLNIIDFHCFLKCLSDCLLFFKVGPGEIPFTLILGASFIAEVFVKTAKEDLLKVYEKKKGVNFSTL